MATLLWQRDVASDVAGVKNTYSSWDACMTKAYCKWPAIIAIIIGSLIVLSLVWCVARCLCCGAECCCGCLSCCNACCPKPRGRRNNDGYYQQPAPPPQPYGQPAYPQYQSHAPPAYMSGGRGGGYRGTAVAKTATFDAPSSNRAGSGAATFNEDVRLTTLLVPAVSANPVQALPQMPSWDTATSKHVEQEVELEKLAHPQAQQESLIPKNKYGYDNGNYNDQYHHQDAAATADLGNMHASPYQEYDQFQQHQQPQQNWGASSVSNTGYPPTYHTASPTSTVYEPAGHQNWGNNGGGYAPSMPPSYRAGPPSISSLPPQQSMGGAGRKPVQGSWRDV
jgi:hypothetical protein